MYISRHVVFNELEFPYKELVTTIHHPAILPSSHAILPSSHAISSPILVPTLENVLVNPTCQPLQANNDICIPVTNHLPQITHVPSIDSSSRSSTNAIPSSPTQSIPTTVSSSPQLPVDHLFSPNSVHGFTHCFF